MGSTFVSKDPSKSDRVGLFNNAKPQPVWLQFVPGIVKNVITNVNSAGYNSSRDINSITAVSHFGEDIRYNAAMNVQYYPLFRGIVDVPVIGDQVLLCTFGGVNYYIGPINTVNSPNWNIDHLNLTDIRKVNKNLYKEKITNRSINGLSKNFVDLPIARLHKIYNEELDHSEVNAENKAINDIHGDFMFEGRHGNSIRIGSRNINPYIMISNGRGVDNILESTTDGSILAMLENGNIRQHFPYDSSIENEEIVESPFVLGSDNIQLESTRMISDMVKIVNDSTDPNDIIYNYNKNQLFQSSDRIMINSRTDSIFLSSFQNIHIGSGNTITLSSKNETIIESKNIYLGKQSKDSENKEPLVLGEQLRLFLEELVDTLEKFHALVQGVPVPVVDSTGALLLPKLQSLKNKLSAPVFQSEYHFIEENGQKTN